MAKVLLIEDDEMIRKIYQDILETKKYEVDTVTTINDALMRLQTSTEPDIILLDIMLPGGRNGFDFLEKARNDPSLSKIPIIVLTALDAERKMALELGAKDYFVKTSITPGDLLKIVKKYIKKKWLLF